MVASSTASMMSVVPGVVTSILAVRDPQWIRPIAWMRRTARTGQNKKSTCFLAMGKAPGVSPTVHTSKTGRCARSLAAGSRSARRDVGGWRHDATMTGFDVVAIAVAQAAADDSAL